MGNQETRKAINYDFSTKLIENNMSEMEIKGTYRKAYYYMGKYLEMNGFEHTQESGYTSIEPMSLADVNDVIIEITNEIPYLKDAIKSIYVTSVGNTYDITDILKNEHDIQIINKNSLYEFDKKYETNLSNEEKEQRTIRFDLSGELLEQAFIKENIDCDTTIAYDWLKKYWCDELNYTHEQRSVYMTPKEKTNAEIIQDLLKFSNDLPYIAECFSSVQATNVGEIYDFTDIANNGTNTILEIEKENIYKQIEMKLDKDNNLYY